MGPMQAGGYNKAASLLLDSAKLSAQCSPRSCLGGSQCAQACQCAPADAGWAFESTTPTMFILQAGGYGKVISHVVIGLRTVKGTKQLKLDPTIYDSLQKEKVVVGDVIYIEANSGEWYCNVGMHSHVQSQCYKGSAEVPLISSVNNWKRPSQL